MTDYDIIGKGTFLECVDALKNKKCDYIYGPQGGIVELDKNECLVYRMKYIDEGKLYFSVDNYLGVWRKLKNK